MVNNFNSQGVTVSKFFEQYKNGRRSRKTEYINFAEDDQMEIQGFAFSKLKTRIVWSFYILTFGILRLIFHWYPQWKLMATHTRCSLEKAEKVLIVDNYYGKFKSYFVTEVHKIFPRIKTTNSEDNIDSTNRTKLLRFNLFDTSFKEVPEARVISCKKLTYIWDENKGKFIKLAGLEKGISRSKLHEFKGQSKEEQDTKRIIYGNNEINVPVQTILSLLLLEALTPFYIFQLFSLIVWFAEAYYYYTIAIIVMSLAGIITSIIQTRKNQVNLKGTVHSKDIATVSRGNGTYEDIPTTDLVPGDVILIPRFGCDMQCDAVLLSGGCIVNESMLTGESVPVTKFPVPDNSTPFSIKEDVNHTLFCGTKVIQTRCKADEKVTAVVIRTGYLTSKGELVRSILYPPPADFKFDRDSYKFIAILSFIALLGFIYTIASKASRQIAPLEILIKALDLITIAVPPALPAAMTVGKLYALGRLKKHKIFCINSRVINVSGSVNCICFDKTGTLTEDELDMWGVVETNNQKMGTAVRELEHLTNDSVILRGMATCHTLIVIDGKLCGDPLDAKMFESTKWTFEDRHQSMSPHNNSVPLVVIPRVKCAEYNEIGIVMQFQFSSTLQRMSVITKSTDKETFEVFCKGSPEMIVKLSRKETVPGDIFTSLGEFTEQGYRVIALGTKTLDNKLTYEDVSKLQRETIECDLTFVGLIILENKLKPQTKEVVKTLKDANMKIVMITGDNVQTAIHVAKESSIVDEDIAIIEVIATNPTRCKLAEIKYHIIGQSKTPTNIEKHDIKNNDIEANNQGKYIFAVTGPSWYNIVKYLPEMIPKIVTKGSIFARMSGLQKQQLVEYLKNLEYYVAMCGDGANDCGALKAAHVGISLSEAESSVASPFTSQEPNIACSTKIIKEGRAALVTSFGVFKFMLCYSLTEFLSVIVLYTIDTNLNSFEFLFIDILLVLNFASFFGITKAYERLDKTTPMTSLLSIVPICSMTLFMLIAIIFQVLAFKLIQTFEGFEDFVYDPTQTADTYSYENYAVFCVSMFQYITMAVVFSKGKPYRMPLYSNKWLSLALVVMTCVCAYITLSPAAWIESALGLLTPPSMNDRLTILCIALVNFFVCIVTEDCLVEKLLSKVIVPKLNNIRKLNPRFMDVGKEDFWPDIVNDESVMLKRICEKNGVVNKGFVGNSD